jgi:hypothetical protein
MANLNCTVTTEGEIALGAATAKTILQIVAPANQRLDLRSFSVSFDGTSAAAEGVQVELMRQTSAGTMTAATPVKDGAGAETIQATAQKNATSEPTSGDILRRYDIDPDVGGYERVFDKRELEVLGGTRLGIRCTAPAAVNVTGHLTWEE